MQTLTIDIKDDFMTEFMKIIHNPDFSKSLKNILRYIANDKPLASLNFNTEVKRKIRKLPKNPFMCPPSQYFEENNVRDMTYKGYTITYEVNTQDEIIEILDIFNRNKP